MCFYRPSLITNAVSQFSITFNIVKYIHVCCSCSCSRLTHRLLILTQYSTEEYIFIMQRILHLLFYFRCSSFGTLSFEIHHIFNTCVVFWHTIQSRDIVCALPWLALPSEPSVAECLILQLRGSNANYNGARKNVVLYPSFVLLSPFQIAVSLARTHTFSFFCWILLPLLKTHSIKYILWRARKQREEIYDLYVVVYVKKL